MEEEPLLAADARADWASVPSIIKDEEALLCCLRLKNKNVVLSVIGTFSTSKHQRKDLLLQLLFRENLKIL